MLKMVSFGANGPVVLTLQRALNDCPPTTFPDLAVDGIFGQKTLARVREFQGLRGLAVDGIVGPMTWGELFMGVGEVPTQTGCNCGNIDAQAQTLAMSVRQDFARSGGVGGVGGSSPSTTLASRTFRTTSLMGFAGGAAGGRTSTASLSGSPFRFLDSGQKTKAKAVFGNSLDFSRIFISNKSGLQGRPFTIAFPDENEIVQIMNCGTFTPKDDTLIHELTHVWQSQHHSDPFRFMVNAVDCQTGAVVVNGKEVFSDPDVLLHHDHPVQFPFSAYAYMPGFGLAGYAAEQMANAVEHGDATVVAHVKSVTMNAVDADNVAALKLTQFGDRRMKGIVF